MDLRRVAADEIDPEDFRSKHLLPMVPVLVSGVTAAAPWGNCAHLCDYAVLADDPEIAVASADVTLQGPFAMKGGQDVAGSGQLLGGDAIRELLHRASAADGGGTPAGEPVMYVKIGLNACPDVLRKFNLESFLCRAGAEPLEPASHPMLLAPGKYYVWVFVGERGTFSATHVDVMCSDAWLVVITGRKEWIMVHPLDKHLVMSSDTGEFCDLFNIDHDKFPNARRARMTRFMQEAGDAIFVPSDAPHAVRNLEPSVSFTFNFLDNPSGLIKWQRMLKRVMSEDRAERTSIIDLSLFSRPLRERITLRGYIDGLAVLPQCDLTARQQLSQLHKQFSIYGRFLDSAATNALPIGCDVCPTDDRVVIFYEFESVEDWRALFHTERSPFVLEALHSESAVAEPSRLFPRTSSHFGRIPCFPPLSVLLNQVRAPFEFPLKALSSAIREAGVAAAASGAPGFDLETMWHYSRFSFIPLEASQQWCASYLFYSSALFTGPMCLHPLREDKTLLPRHPCCRDDDADGSAEEEEVRTSSFDPHFVQLRWDLSRFTVGANGDPLCVAKFDGELDLRIIKGIVMHPGYARFTDSCQAHRLVMPDLGDSGVEKVLAAVMWFSTTPGLVGFTYSHTFSTVQEPHTLCLTASVASALLKPQLHTAHESAKRGLAEWMTTFCNVICGRSDVEALAGIKRDVSESLLAHWLEIKSSDSRLGGESEESKEMERCITKVRKFLSL